VQTQQIDIDGHLILPFGTATKSDINRIRLARVDAGGIRLESDVPVVYIQKDEKQALRLRNFLKVFPYNHTEIEHLLNDERAGLD
jgi:ribosome-interacting GTPase 1